MTSYSIGDYETEVNMTVNGSSFQDLDLVMTGDSAWNHVIEDIKRRQLTLHEPTTIVLMTLYVTIFLMSFIGNVLVLLVIVPNQRMWTVTNNFLVNLAVADLLVTLLCMPMTLAGKVYKLWIYGNILCKLTPYLQGVSVAASTFTITVMSLDRCLAILYPVKFRNMRTKRNVRILIVLLWLTALLLMIPLTIVNKTKSEKITESFSFVTCVEDWGDITQRRAYDFSLLFIICLIPALIVFVSYLRMGKRLWVTDSSLKTTESAHLAPTRRLERGSSIMALRASRRKMAKLCIVVSVVFVVCWLPYYIVNIHMDFNGSEELVDIVYWGLFIGHLHCITNPILYCFMHKSFRYGAKRLLPCWNTESLTRGPSVHCTLTGVNGGSFRGDMRHHTRHNSGSLSSPNLRYQCSITSDSANNGDKNLIASYDGQSFVSSGGQSSTSCKARKVRLILSKLKSNKRKSPETFKLNNIVTLDDRTC